MTGPHPPLLRPRRGGRGGRLSARGAEPVRFKARVRIDTPREAEYFRHGGILQFVLRQLLIGK